MCVLFSSKLAVGFGRKCTLGSYIVGGYVTAGFEPGLVSFQLISRLCYSKLDLPFLLRLTYFCFL